MEKLQPILSGLKKHHFWIVCVIAIGAILGGWYMALEELPLSFTKNKQEVKRKFEDLTKIEIKQIPGQTWPDEAGKKARALHGELATAAKKLQAGQENEWPKALGNEFQGAVIKFGRAGKWPAERLDAYQKTAADEVDRLKKLVNPNDGPQAGGVQWDADDFKQWRDQFVWAAPITNAEVMFEAQEKLWVAKAILQSIVSTNEGATDRFNLPISMIEVFEIGPGALRNRPSRQIEVQAAPAPIPAPAPAAPPAGAPPAAPGAAPPPPKPPAAPPAALATIKPVSGLRAIPIRIRVKMNPDMLGRLEAAMVNQRGVPIIIDDVYFAHDVKLVRERGAREPVAPAPEPAPGGAAAPAANAAGGPGARPAAPGVPGGPAAVAPGAPAGVAGPGAVAAPGNPVGPGAVEEPVAVPASPPHLVQVPRGSIVEIQATAYFVDMGQVEALKVAMSDKGRL